MDYQFAAKDWDNGSQPWKLRVLMILIDDNDTITYIYATVFSSNDPVYGASTFDPGDNLTFVNIDNETDLGFGSFFICPWTFQKMDLQATFTF